MAEFKLSIIIPVYNEAQTIGQVFQAAKTADLPPGFSREIIIIDDGSTDDGRRIIQGLEQECQVILQPSNQGKGAAVRAGIQAAGGDYVIIQDADLEYNPNEYSSLLSALLENKADMVYGSRFLGGAPRRALLYWHFFGNRIITLISNICTNLNLTDVETGYKCFNRAVRDCLAKNLSSNRFGVEIEITALVARRKYRIYEVGIAYAGRTYAEGKKIGWRDGVAALWFIFYYNFIKRYS